MKLSIIIATHARAAALGRLLDSLVPQLRRERHELFIAENGTPAPTALDAQLPLTHLYEARPGKCRVQNRAIAAARGELIACLDDDLIVCADYVAEVENFFDTNRQFAAMKGRILPAEDPAVKVGELTPYLDLPLVDEGERVIEVRGVLGANMAFRAAALRQVGPFDERLGPGAAGHEEETEMSQRIRRAGFAIGYAPAAIVYHEVDPARASRERFIRIARERGYCRTLHERHSRWASRANLALACTRLTVARIVRAPLSRIAREERRAAVARGILDGLKRRR
ncbi:MAG TPA: glycosyltransferase [Candidatus Binataceae bacterium]|nr:glycosyltransferase [Candidatus Binataceae bacterium]